MKLYGVRIFVDDLDKARQFYTTTLALPLTWDMPDLGAFGAGLENAELIVERGDPTDPEATGLIGRFVGVSLAVGNIDATYQTLLEAGVRFTSPPTKQPWGGTLAHFFDSAGNTLTLLGE